jgi:hypothetical protein
MRIKTIHMLCTAAHWVQKLLAARVPMDAVAGLRTHRRF